METRAPTLFIVYRGWSCLEDYFINHHKDPVIKQSGFNGSCRVRVFVSWLTWYFFACSLESLLRWFGIFWGEVESPCIATQLVKMLFNLLGKSWFSGKWRLIFETRWCQLNDFLSSSRNLGEMMQFDVFQMGRNHQLGKVTMEIHPFWNWSHDHEKGIPIRKKIHSSCRDGSSFSPKIPKSQGEKTQVTPVFFGQGKGVKPTSCKNNLDVFFFWAIF